MKLPGILRSIQTLSLIAFLVIHLSGQSLGDLARKEAERRKNLEQQGVPAKVIQDIDVAKISENGNLSVFSPAPEMKSRAQLSSSGAKGSPVSFRNRLQKLDREIRQIEDRLAELRARLVKERWAPPRSGRRSRSTRSGSTEERLQSQIRSLEIKVKYLRQDHSETYSAGRKAGFLPGELDGKGIIP